MARTAKATIATALTNLKDTLAAAERSIGSRAVSALDNLGSIASTLNASYTPTYNLTVTDTADADLAAFFAGELVAASVLAIKVGDVFSVNGTGDTTNNALEAAKGSAVAANDLFEVTDISTEAVAYVGTTAVIDISAIRA